MTKNRAIIVSAICVLVGSVLVGCREEEQGRALIVHKGEYAGQMDQALNANQLSELNDRVTLQGGAISGPAPTAGPPADNPPAPATSASDKALSNRLQMQSGN